MSETEILGYTRHPASAVWPDLGADEYAALRDNIRDQGQDHAILATPDKQVIDGWHRLRACAEIDCPPQVTTAHFTEEEIARKVIGAHVGRRHIGKSELARFVIETELACGGRFAERGEHPPADQTAQNDPSVITRGSIAGKADVSEATATRAIQDAKRDRGLLPRKPAKTKPPEPETETPPEAPAETPITEPQAAEAPAGDSLASPAVEHADGEGEAAVAPPPQPANGEAESEDETPVDRLTQLRAALAQIEEAEPAEDVAALDDDRRAQYAELGELFVAYGRAMMRAAAKRAAERDGAESGGAHNPPASDCPDIPPFLDRRGAA